MKNVLILLTTGIIFTLTGYAQNQILTDSVPVSFEQQITDLFQHVDLNQVINSNGILYEHGFPIYKIEPFNGTLTDSSKTSMLSFSLLYASLYSMALNDSSRLPHPDAYRNICDTVTKRSPIIPVIMLHQEISRIDTNAIANNQFTISNDQLYDVAGRPASPYYKQEVFTMTPAKSEIVGSTLNLKVDSNLLFNNTHKTLQDIEIDMGSGSGYRKVNIGQVLSASYDSSQATTVKFKVTYTDASIYYSHADVTIKVPEITTRSSVDDPYDTPDDSVHIFATEFHEGGYGGGKIYVSYACGHTSIQKPFIWAEGYNPKVGGLNLSLGYKDAWERLNNEIEISPGTFKTLSEYLVEEGYDLIVLDYDDGADYLPRTALFIEEAIRWVNKKKHEAGSTEKNVIIGQSMGGMCSKLALRRMEVNGEDHEVGTYISFDSGQQGVNLPLGATNLFRHLSALNIGSLPLSLFVQMIDDAIDLSNKPASRTMPYYQPLGVANLNNSYYTLQNDTYGMPQNCEVLAIANGSKLGGVGGQNFNSGDLIFQLKENTYSLINNLLGWDNFLSATVASVGSLLLWNLGINVKSDIKIWAMPHNPYSYEEIYKGKIKVKVVGFWVVHENRTVEVTNCAGIDAAPGGLIFPHTASVIPGPIAPDVYKLGGFCFTPTTSTLNHHSVDGTN